MFWKIAFFKILQQKSTLIRGPVEKRVKNKVISSINPTPTTKDTYQVKHNK